MGRPRLTGFNSGAAVGPWGLCGVLSAFAIPLANRSSAPGSSFTSGGLGSLDILKWFRGNPLTVSRRLATVIERMEGVPADQGQWAFYTRLGVVTVLWASIETCVDHTNWIVLWAIPESRTIAEELPVSFKPKIRFFEDIHRELAVLKPYRDEGLWIAEAAKRLVGRRHDLLHGLSAYRDGRYRFQRARYKGDTLHLQVTNYSTEQLDKLITDMDELSCRVGNHFNELARLLVPNYKGDYGDG